MTSTFCIFLCRKGRIFVEALFFLRLFKLFLILFFLYSRFYYLSILYILVYICQSQSPNSSHHHHPSPTSPFGVHTFVLYICVSVSALQTSSSVPFFFRFHIYALIYNIYFSLSDLHHSV